MMFNIINSVLGAFISLVFIIILQKKNIYFIIIVSFLLTINTIYLNGISKLIFSIFSMAFSTNLFYKSGVTKSIVIAITFMFLTAAFEVFIMIFLIMAFENISFLTNNYAELAELIFTLLNGLFIFWLIKNKKINKIINKIINNIDKNIPQNIMLIVILGLSVITFAIYHGKKALLLHESIIMNIFIAFVFFLSIYQLIKRNYENANIKEKQNIIMKDIQKYEELINQKEIIEHEQKNKLIIAKTMVKKNNKQLLQYLDSLIIEKQNTSESKKSIKLPRSRLKSLIQYKIKNNEKIVNFIIQEKLSNKKILALNNSNYDDVCQLIGIYIDNAIEATKKAQKPSVIIEINSSPQSLSLSMANTYDGDLLINQFDNKGYTTKKDSKGLGLYIATKIYQKNKMISQNREIINDYYIQTLTINFTS